MTLLILLIGGGFFAYGIIHKPEWVAVALFTLIIANINIDLNSLPLNLRAIITLALFGRIMIDKITREQPAFFGRWLAAVFLVYTLYIMLVTFGEGLFTFELLKTTLSTVIAMYCAYHFYLKNENGNVIKSAMMISGIICFADLAYTYAVFGSFPVQRLITLVTGGEVEEMDPDGFFVATVNHNFFGQISGMAFVFIFSDLIKNKQSGRFTVLLLPIMFMTVLMSTSRSALMALIVVSAILIFNGVKHKEERKKVSKIASFALAAIVVGILLFTTLGMYFKLDSKFVDEVVFRLTDEPIAIMKKALGQNYNVQNLGSMDWREEASADAYAAYMHLPFNEQLVGIGQGGFLDRNLGHGLNPHNGILLILIETGILGLLLYIIMMAGAIYEAVKLKHISPSFAVVVFVLIYGIGQNGEMTSTTTFIFFATMIAEQKFLKMTKDDPEYNLEPIHA